MQLVSVNIGTVQPIKHGKPSGKTGIFKMPTADPLMISPLGLQNDAIVDTENHGGLDQAVYIFTTPDYEWWSNYIQRPLAPGTFGENLTISELESQNLHVGDRLQIGSDVVLEITSPRVPCVTLAARMEDPQFVIKFRRAERPGAYCRVIKAGHVKANDPVTLIPFAGEQVGIVETFRAFYRKQLDAKTLEHFLAAPIHYKERAYYQEMLENLRLA